MSGVPAAQPETPVVVFDRVSLAFDEKVILDEVSFELLPGRMKIFLGASGAGKSTILRLLLGLLRPDSGAIWVHGRRIDGMSEWELMSVRAELGMVFQEGALFDSLTVRENVGYRLYEETQQPIAEVDARVREVLGFVGLDGFEKRLPSEISGGERRRVAIARAMAARPRVLLYDEPTTGLDPITALTIDHEIIKLRDVERVTSIIVTHQLRDAFYIATHEAVEERRTAAGMREVARTTLAEASPSINSAAAPAPAISFRDASPARVRLTEFLMLKDGKLVFRGDAEQLRASSDPYLIAFLAGNTIRL